VANFARITRTGVDREGDMSEQDNVALLQRGFDAFNSADVDTLTDIIADDAVQHMPGKGQFSGDFKGRDAILGMYGGLGEATGGTFAAKLEGLKADGPDKVVADYRAQATRQGKTLDSPRQLTFTVKDGQIADIADSDAAVDAWDDFFD